MSYQAVIRDGGNNLIKIQSVRTHQALALNTTGNYNSFLDRRLKTNIKDLNSGIDFILKLRPVEYQLKQSDGKSFAGI